MTDAGIGTTTITQIGIIIADIEAKSRAWSEILSLPLPDLRDTDGYNETQAEYDGAPTDARAKLAFFNLGQHGIPLVQRREYIGGRYAYLDGIGPLGTIVELLEND